MTERVEVRFCEPDGTVANDAWTGVVRKIQMLDGGRTIIRLDHVTAFYSGASRVVRYRNEEA